VISNRIVKDYTILPDDGRCAVDDRGEGRPRDDEVRGGEGPGHPRLAGALLMIGVVVVLVVVSLAGALGR
jgi:hypothetical protein